MIKPGVGLEMEGIYTSQMHPWTLFFPPKLLLLLNNQSSQFPNHSLLVLCYLLSPLTNFELSSTFPNFWRAVIMLSIHDFKGERPFPSLLLVICISVESPKHTVILVIFVDDPISQLH